MANVFDVADYIIHKMPDISTMKLQKLCYYSQAWTLAWDGIPIFEEDFQAWANGPVCYELFNEHRGKFKVGSDTFKSKTSSEGLTQTEKDNIDIILEDYGNKTPHWLSELTHKERPWKETRGDLDLGASSDAVIEKELMQDYYNGLLANG